MPIEEAKLSTGSEVLDILLGGFEVGIITTSYGPSSSGKTCFCLQAALSAAKEKKIIYIDSEGGFSSERMKQLSPEDPSIFDKVILFSPTSFSEQNKVIGQLPNIVNEKIGLIVVDSIAMLYRLEMHRSEDAQLVNKQLGLQLACLTEIARKNRIPVIVTNQVYARFDDRDKVHMVGGDLLRYTSKCLIELQKNETARKAILHKHRSMPEMLEVEFMIKKEGTVLKK